MFEFLFSAQKLTRFFFLVFTISSIYNFCFSNAPIFPQIQICSFFRHIWLASEFNFFFLVAFDQLKESCKILQDSQFLLDSIKVLLDDYPVWTEVVPY